MRRFLSLFTMLMLCGVLAFAQNRVVTGKIVDDKGNGVPFASVKIENSKVGTSTESDGSFSIKADNSTVLAISSSGFENQKVTVGSQNFIGITLVTTATALQEVIVTTALGQQRQKSSLGFSTATVKGAELTQAHATNIAQGLTGKISGATFLQTNSGVFQDTRITLRGIRSLTGDNQPMLILDGVPISLGFLSSINPNDIASVDILKSAGSTAIYGPDGVNGAIVITTKRGSKAKPQISFSQSTQFESVSYMPKFQSRWGSGYNQDATGSGVYEPHEQQSWGDEFDGSIRQIGDPGPNGMAPLTSPYSYIPGERKRFFDVGVTNQTDVSFSTGDFYLSGQNVDIKGTVPGDVNNRRTFTFRAEKEYNKFKAIFNAHYTQSKYNVTSSNTLIYYGVTGAPGNIPLTQFSDWRNDYYSSPNGYYTLYLSNQEYSPYFTKDINRQFGKTDDVFGDVEFNYKATNWLNFVYRVGLSVSDANNTATKEAFSFASSYFDRPDAGVNAGTTAGVDNANSYSNRLTSEFFANLNKSFGKVGVSATFGHSFRESRSRYISAGSSNLGKSEFLSIAARLGEPTVTVDNSMSRLQRFFGRVSFDINKWLFLEATGSYDRDSRLVPANKIFETKDISLFYPGASASLLLHEIIPGLKDNKILNFLKVRGAISKTGNVNLGVYQNEQSFSPGTFFPFGTLAGFLQGATIYQQGITPEFVNTKEVGIEMGFLKNRISLEATYYNQNNTDQILNVQLSNTSGATTKVENAGAFTNSGLELDLKLTPLVKLGDVSVDFKVNYSLQNSKITRLTDGVDELGLGNYNYAVVGSSAFVFKLTDYNRDPASGKVIVNPTTGMPTVNSNLTQFGQTLPDNILGLSVNVNWKGFTLGAVAEYRTGNQIVADQLGQFLDDNGISARSGDYGRRAFVFPNSVVLDAGSGKYVPNTNVYTQNYGRLFYNDDLNTTAISNYLADGSFWKLREVTLSYNFPSELFKGNGIKGVQIGITGRNLLMWLPKSNQWTDPEFTANGNGSYTGNAVGRSTAFNMPPTRIIGANVTVQF